MHRAFRHADEVTGLIGGYGGVQRVGIGEAHFQHAGDPVHGGVRIGIAHGLVQRGNQIVVLLALLVVEQRLAGSAGLQRVLGDGDHAVFIFGVEHEHFQSGEGGAGVAVGKGGDDVQHVGRHVDGLTAESSGIVQGAPEQGLHVFFGERMQHEHLAAGKKRAVHLEGRIFRGRADEHDAALLHEGQKGVLLRLVEAVYFVHEEHGAPSVLPVLFGLLHDGAYFLDAAGDGGKIDEVRFRVSGDDAGQRGFAHARRPPEDHGGNLIGFYELAQHLALAEKMFLTEKFIQRARAQTGGQRLGGFGIEKGMLFHAFS